jgi:hypothetical protein
VPENSSKAPTAAVRLTTIGRLKSTLSRPSSAGAIRLQATMLIRQRSWRTHAVFKLDLVAVSNANHNDHEQEGFGCSGDFIDRVFFVAATKR